MTPTRRNYTENWIPSIFNDFFDNDWMARANATAPAINVTEDEHSYGVELAAPGMCKEDFNIRLTEDNQLQIVMEKKEENKTEQPEKKYLRREFHYSKFEQCLVLPDDVEKDRIEASMENGVLLITLPKMTQEEKAQSCKLIDIK